LKLALLEDGIYEFATGNPMASGNGKWQWLLSRALAQSGFSIVVGVREHLRSGHEQTIDGVRFFGMQRGHLVLAWSKFLTTEKPNWWYYQGADPLWPILLFVAKAKRVSGIFSTSTDGDVKPRTALFRRQRWWPLYAWGLNSVERIFVQHEGQFSGLNPKLQSKARVVPGLVSTGRNVKPRETRRNHVAWVAFLRDGKRPDLLVEMARDCPDLRFVVCGGVTTYLTSPGYAERIVKELRSLPNVEYMGHVTAEQCLETVGDAVALLCTSEFEGFPNTFLEAWSVGTPVVSLGIDPGNVIKREGLGFVSGKLQQAIHDVRTLLNSAETFDAVSRRTRAYIENVHSDAAVARLFSETLACCNETLTPDRSEAVGKLDV
jgi:glycosyltransferase involved in cell wall biosynthesis